MKSKYFFGLVLMVVGSLLLLENLGIINDVSIWQYVLPIIILGIGLSNIFSKKRANTIDILFIVIGLALFASYLGVLGRINIWKLVFPIVIIVFGARMFIRRGNYSDGSTVFSNRVSANAFFSGTETVCTSNNFEYGDANAVFGGVTLDLRGANTTMSTCHLDVNAVFGGIEIIVPVDWAVYERVTPLFGGFDNKTNNPSNPTTVLNITGTAFCGGIEIYNKY